MPAPIVAGIGIANLLNHKHKLVAKRGAHFTIMVVGEFELGKTTLINTLFSTELSSSKNNSRRLRSSQRSRSSRPSSRESRSRSNSPSLTRLASATTSTTATRGHPSSTYLISTTEESHYENYRQEQMETHKFGEPKVKKLDNPKFREEEEGLLDRRRFTEQIKAEDARSRQWERHLLAERDRLNKDLAHSAVKQLEAELDNLQAGYGRGSQRR